MKKLKPRTPINQALSAEIVDRIDTMIILCLPPDVDSDALHKVRIAGKELRALLDLVRRPLREDAYLEALGALRTALAPLSALRDKDTLHKALADLAGGENAGDEALWCGLKPVDFDSDDVQETLVDFREHLHALRNRFDLTDLGLSRDDIARAVGRSYARNLKISASATVDPTPAALHEWRKAAKRLYYQLRWLRAVVPDVIRCIEFDLKKLSVRLGDIHDLTSLQSALKSEALCGKPGVKNLEEKAQLRIAKARKWALGRASQLYAQSPRDIRRAIAGNRRKAEADSF